MKLCATITTAGSKFSPIIFIGDYIEQLEKANISGFQAVELHVRDPREIDAERILKKANSLGIDINSIGTGQAYVDEGLAFTSKDEVIYEKAVRRIKDQIDLAAYWNSLVIIGTIRGMMPPNNEERDGAYRRLIKAMRECARYAGEKNVTLALEAINRYEMNYLNTAAETLDFISEVGEAALGIHLDTFHMNIEEAYLPEAVLSTENKLVHFHFADSNRLAPGWGHTDFLEILSALKKINYQGAISLEHLPLPEPLEAARQSRSHLEKLLVRIS